MQDFNIRRTRPDRRTRSLIAAALLLASGISAAATHNIQCTFMPTLNCVDAQGNALWSSTEFNDATASAEDPSRLFISQSGRTYAFSRQDGRQLWQARTESDAIYFYPVIDADSVYLARTDGVLEKRQSDSGFVVWRSQPGKGWVYPPVQSRGKLFTGGQDGMIWQLDPKTGAPIGQYKLDQEMVAPMIVSNGLLITATFDGKLTAYRASNNDRALLRTVWQADIGTAVFDMRTVKKDLIISDMGGQVSSIDALNGNINWQAMVHRNARYWNTIDRKSLYSLTNTGILNIIDLQSGRQLDQLQFSGEFSRAPIVQHDAIVLFDINGVTHRPPLSMASTPATSNTPEF